MPHIPLPARMRVTRFHPPDDTLKATRKPPGYSYEFRRCDLGWNRDSKMLMVFHPAYGVDFLQYKTGDETLRCPFVHSAFPCFSGYDLKILSGI